MIQIDEYLQPIEIACILCTATVDIPLSCGKMEAIAHKAAGEQLKETVTAFTPDELAELGRYLVAFAEFNRARQGECHAGR